MSRLLFAILAALCLSVLYPTTQRAQHVDSEQTPSLYRIRRIRQKESYNIIYASRNDSTFVILSDSDNSDISNLEKIKSGGYYNLELVVVFPLESFHGINILPNPGIKRMSLRDNSTMRPRKKYHNKIYNAANLNGLYLETN